MMSKNDYRRRVSRRRRSRFSRHLPTFIVLFVLTVLIGGCIFAVSRFLFHKKSGPPKDTEVIASATAGTAPNTEVTQPTEPALDEVDRLIAQADRLAAGYDYDGAVALVESDPAASSDPRGQEAISGYLATKDIIAERHLDFGAIKCMPDLTNFRAPQCISTALLNGGYDGDGEFEPFPISCEADADGALSMEILKLVSGGMPTMFADVSHIGYAEKLIYLPNCGSMCTYYAGRSCDGCRNMKNIELRRANRPSGGAVTFTVPSAGAMTMARLCRVDGAYQMFIIETEFVEPSKEILDAFVKARGVHQLPVAFMKADFDIEKFVDVFNSNHISGVAGNYKQELIDLCGILGIEPVVIG